MTGDDLREALKWFLVVAGAVTLWCGVLAVRKARGAGQEEPNESRQPFIRGSCAFSYDRS